jgi:hypothetical protein
LLATVDTPSDDTALNDNATLPVTVVCACATAETDNITELTKAVLVNIFFIFIFSLLVFVVNN